LCGDEDLCQKLRERRREKEAVIERESEKCCLYCKIVVMEMVMKNRELVKKSRILEGGGGREGMENRNCVSSRRSTHSCSFA
jgi:hypothetical protein